ncbi:hypothetical protein TrCOL_g2144 [Triparma columacea]|uniref:RRM domain-containing protein n=1 Tax=Triparma columacea TaxID=722753 RepID=A0A9W7GLJ0_9STRA|nr:hypothetical protein TrCOL_g2144 [Triparma columacea]
MEEAILKAVRSSTSDVLVKSLRSTVLLSLQMEVDKEGKKAFKGAVKDLEKGGKLEVTEEGVVKIKEGKKRKAEGGGDEGGEGGKKEKKDKKEKKEKKDKKSKKDKDVPSSVPPPSTDAASPTLTAAIPKNAPCPKNRDGVSRLFLGNLPFTIDEETLKSHLPGTVTHIKWITDKETGRFYGSAFVEMLNSLDAAAAVGVAGSQIMGRPIKVNFAPAREGDVWPPPTASVTGGAGGNKSTTGGQAGGGGVKALAEKPEGCCKLFIGNLSYDIDDDGIFKFFGNVEAEVKAVRWLHHKDSGDFKGVGYVEFWNTEACERAAGLNGKNLLGRPIRIDWTD